MTPAEILAEFQKLGALLISDGDAIRCPAPRGAVSDHLLSALRDRKVEVLAVLAANKNTVVTATSAEQAPSRFNSGPCTCDPLPSINQYGNRAHAGCGPEYIRCSRCGKTWHCKLCGGCRYCRTPG